MIFRYPAGSALRLYALPLKSAVLLRGEVPEGAGAVRVDGIRVMSVQRVPGDGGSSPGIERNGALGRLLDAVACVVRAP
jgi:hypothetical protein